MKIISSTLGMDASTVYKDVSKTEGHLAGKSSNQAGLMDSFRLDLPDAGIGLLRVAARRESSAVRAVSTLTSADRSSSHDWSEETVVGRIVSEVVGLQVQVRDLTPVRTENADTTASNTMGDSERGQIVASGGGQVILGLQQIESRKEELSVSSSGTVVTDDGREIQLRLELSLEREEFTGLSGYSNAISSRFIDPLVLSFSDGLSILGDSRFCFDLNCDGETEEISSLKSGSGFLVLDKNHDSAINDGGELFGPESGYGYDELSIYDADGNNWIDENDPVFDQLQLWMGGGSDTGSLVSLRQAGVGALSLASADVHFNLKDRDGRIIGQVGRSGLFVTEDGAVRPLAEIDLAIYEESLPEERGAFSSGLGEAIQILRVMIADRRRRVESQMALQFKEEKVERQKDWLLKRLLNLPDDASKLTG